MLVNFNNLNKLGRRHLESELGVSVMCDVMNFMRCSFVTHKDQLIHVWIID
jgi:hypothetical protein